VVRLVPGDLVDRVVEPEELVEEVRRAYLSEGVIPRRVVVERKGVWIGVMPGVVEGMGFATKIVGIFPKAIPPVRGIVVLLDFESGELLSIIDGTTLTGWRTAAASALAYRIVGGGRIESLGVIGAGTQGRYHAMVFAKLFKPSEILIYDLAFERAVRLADCVGGRAVELTQLLAKSDVIISATNSKSPVVLGKYVKEGAVVISVGAPKPVRELDDELLRRARCALVDNVEGVLEETDDRPEELVGVGDALRGARCEFGGVKLYKSVGFALLDVAAAHYVYRKALELGVGLDVKL